MDKETRVTSAKFDDVVSQITDVGIERHSRQILTNAQNNLPFTEKGFKDLEPLNGAKARSAIVVSAGPSLHRYRVLEKIKKADFQGTIVAVDGSLVKCLKNGIVPDFVLSLDPHPTRIARWFGDYDFEKNFEHDDYFKRQDLDVEFRNNSLAENQKNIDLVNEHGKDIKLVLCSSAPENVVTRAVDAKFNIFWWNPIVDDPSSADSLTRAIYQVNQKSCMNTGGTVGTAAWVFANAVLKIPNIALTGMDLGYHIETPYSMTQTYYELHEYVESEEEFEALFPKFTFPSTGEQFYTDPTYFWYRKNLLELLERASGNTVNCTGAGTLFSENLACESLDSFLERVK